jgi:hypothetical protein
MVLSDMFAGSLTDRGSCLAPKRTDEGSNTHTESPSDGLPGIVSRLWADLLTCGESGDNNRTEEKL